MLEDTHEIHIEKDKENDTYKIDHPSVLSRSQKLIASLLAFFAFFTVIVWSMQLKNNIDNPFDFKTEDNKTIVEIIRDEEADSCDGQDCQEEDLRMKDTDGDGLWDWDEINVYYTSIYLEDTDSDGILDKDEVDGGGNPNCSEGQDCVEESFVSTELNKEILQGGDKMSQAEMFELLSQLESLEEGENSVPGSAVELGSSEEAMQELLGGSASASNLRVMLKNAGMDVVMLENLSDEQLIDVYTKMLK